MFSVGILTISDKGWRGDREDESGRAIRELVGRLQAAVTRYELVPDEKDLISRRLKEWADGEGLDLVVTSGGTGLGPRDVTPEATLEVSDRLVPGMAEAMRAESLKHTPHGMLSRGVTAVRKRTLIINLPGSPKAVRQCLEVVMPALPHAIELIKGEAGECAAEAHHAH